MADGRGGIEFLAAIGARVTRTFDLALLAEAQVLDGEAQEALASVDDALAMAQSCGQRYYQAELHRVRGELLSQTWPAQRGEATRELQHAVELARAPGAVSFEKRAFDSLARVTVEVRPRPGGPGH